MKRKALVFFAIFSVKGWACSCIPAPPPEVAYEQATAVFVGRVIGIEPVPAAKASGRELLRCTFEIEGPADVFKGAERMAVGAGKRGPVVVRTASNSAACGFPFAVDQLYLVYAMGDNTLATNSCTRTRLLARVAEDELKTLRLLTKKG